MKLPKYLIAVCILLMIALTLSVIVLTVDNLSMRKKLADIDAAVNIGLKSIQDKYNHKEPRSPDWQLPPD